MKSHRFPTVLLIAVFASLLTAVSAQAAYSVTDYKLTPSTKQAAAHPKVHFHIYANASVADSTGGDDISSLQVQLPAGLLVNPAGPTARCSSAGFAADSCSSNSRVGTTNIKWRGNGSTVNGNGTAYLLDSIPSGGNARVGLVFRPSGWKKFFLTADVNGLGLVRTGADAPFGLTLTIAGIPRTHNLSTGASRSITVSELNVDLNARSGTSSSAPYFTVNPSRCSAADSRATVVTHAGVSTVKTGSFLPTGCANVPFNPTAAVTATNLIAGASSGLTATFSVPSASATIQNSNVSAIAVDLPSGAALNAAALTSVTPCSATELAAAGCPASSRIGGAAANIPFLSSSITGDVFVTASSATSAQIAIVLRGGGQRIVQLASIANTATSVSILASGLPQIAWSSIGLTITSAVVKNPSTCGSQNATTTLNGYSGAAATRVGSYGNLVCVAPPETTITSGPTGPTSDSTPTWDFTASYGTATFSCLIDDGAFSPCASPYTSQPLTGGAHRFCVVATVDGLTEATPECASFTVEMDPTFNQTITNPAINATTGATWSWSSGAASHLKRLMITQSPTILANYAAYANICPSNAISETLIFDPTLCAANAKIGTITIDSPDYSGQVSGDVYAVQKAPWLPWFAVDISPSTNPGNPAGLTVRFVFFWQGPQVDPTCDSSVEYCQAQSRYGSTQLPDITTNLATLTITRPIFAIWSECVPPLTTSALLIPFAGANTTVVDSDPIAGC